MHQSKLTSEFQILQVNSITSYASDFSHCENLHFFITIYWYLKKKKYFLYFLSYILNYASL